jgi:hypothetical protein
MALRAAIKLDFTKLNSISEFVGVHSVTGGTREYERSSYRSPSILNPYLIEKSRGLRPNADRNLRHQWSLEVDVTPLLPAFVRKQIISLTTTLSVTASSLALAQDPKQVLHPQGQAREAEEQQFLFANDLAISNMSREMLVKPTGDVDRDFVAIMIPQRQAAIDMARAELKYGQDEELRRLAQSIVDDEEREISTMRHSSEQLPLTQQPGEGLAAGTYR